MHRSHDTLLHEVHQTPESIYLQKFRPFQTGRLFADMQIWQYWTAEALPSLLLDSIHALDYLKDRKDKTSSPTRMMTYEALRFMSLKLNLPFLPVAQSQTVSYFLQIPMVDSLQTLLSTLQFYKLGAWVQRTIADHCPHLKFATLGCFFTTTMAPLRFRDLLRSKPARAFVKCVLQFGCFLEWRLWPLTKSAFAQKYGLTHFIPDVFCNNNKWCFPQDLLV